MTSISRPWRDVDVTVYWSDTEVGDNQRMYAMHNVCLQQGVFVLSAADN